MFAIASLVGLRQRLHRAPASVPLSGRSAAGAGAALGILHARMTAADRGARRKAVAAALSYCLKTKFEDLTAAIMVRAFDTALADPGACPWMEAAGAGAGSRVKARKAWPLLMGACFLLAGAYMEALAPNQKQVLSMVRDTAASIHVALVHKHTYTAMLRVTSAIFSMVTTTATPVVTHHQVLSAVYLRLRAAYLARDPRPDPALTALSVARTLSLIALLWPSNRCHSPTAIAAAILRASFAWLASNLASEDVNTEVVQQAARFSAPVASLVGDIMAACRRRRLK